MIVVVTLLMYESGIELLQGERTSQRPSCYMENGRVTVNVVTRFEYESSTQLLQESCTSQTTSCYMSRVRVKEKLLHK